MIERDGFSIEVNTGRDDPVESITFHVRGSGSGALAVVAQMLARLDLRAIDTQSGEFFAEGAAAGSFETWQAFRDDVV